MSIQTITFSAGDVGAWAIQSVTTLCGEGLALAPRLAISDGALESSVWRLRGVVSNLRYTTSPERTLLQARQAPLGRSETTRAALIPIRKSQAWWSLAQDERRAIFEEQSRHTTIGVEYLPQIARRLHHARDLGEPFDFLTWFEFAPEHAGAFDDLLARLRASAEWSYVEREIDIRLEAFA